MSLRISRIIIFVGIVALMGCVAEKERVRRHRCMENLGEIGKRCIRYANGHGGSFPHSLSDVTSVEGESIADSGRVFICPSSGTHPGVISKVDDWSDYMFISGVTTNDPPNTMLAYDSPQHHRADGAPVLYIDGSVMWHDREEFGRLRTKYGSPLK